MLPCVCVEEGLCLKRRGSGSSLLPYRTALPLGCQPGVLARVSPPPCTPVVLRV